MFDLSFLELLVIGIVALVVVGPERLPRVARTAGHWVGHARRTLSGIKAEIDREVKFDELKELQRSMAESARRAEFEIIEEADRTRRQVQEGVKPPSAGGPGEAGDGEGQRP